MTAERRRDPEQDLACADCGREPARLRTVDGRTVCEPSCPPARLRELAVLLHPSVCETAGAFGWEHLPAYLPEHECQHVARSLINRGLTVTPMR